MVPLPDAVSAKVALGLLSLAVSLGVDERALCEKMGLSSTDPADYENGVPARCLGLLLREAKRALGDELIGIHLAEQFPIGLLGFVYHSAHASQTLRAAYQRGVRFQALIEWTAARLTRRAG